MKKYVWISLTVVVLLLVGTGYAAREITFAQYTGGEASAQAALDNTVMNKITDAVPYTGGMNGFFFTGADKSGRTVYAWTEEQKVVATTFADAGLSHDKAIEAAKHPVWAKTLATEFKPETQQPMPIVDVIHAVPGPVLQDSKAQFRTAPSKCVWEIFGKLQDGRSAYLYLDFKSGEALWQYALDNSK